MSNTISLQRQIEAVIAELRTHTDTAAANLRKRADVLDQMYNLPEHAAAIRKCADAFEQAEATVFVLKAESEKTHPKR